MSFFILSWVKSGCLTPILWKLSIYLNWRTHAAQKSAVKQRFATALLFVLNLFMPPNSLWLFDQLEYSQINCRCQFELKTHHLIDNLLTHGETLANLTFATSIEAGIYSCCLCYTQNTMVLPNILSSSTLLEMLLKSLITSKLIQHMSSRTLSLFHFYLYLLSRLIREYFSHSMEEVSQSFCRLLGHWRYLDLMMAVISPD